MIFIAYQTIHFFRKVGLSSFKKNCFLKENVKFFKNEEKSFLLNLKSSFLSQDILSRLFGHV